MRLKSSARKFARRVNSKVRWQDRVNDRDAARFDRSLGIDTSGRLYTEDMTVSEGDASLGVRYDGTFIRAARWWMKGLPTDRGRYTFIDMGSGKGRVLFLAKKAGFGRAIGIEYAEELHTVAARNAEKAATRQVVVETYHGDAGAFEFPDEPLVVHFYNPFHDPVMVRVIANLTESHRRQPRPIVVMYHQMTVEEPEDATNNFALLDAVPFLTGRTLDPPRGILDRGLFGYFTVRIYESDEVRNLSRDASDPKSTVK